VSVEGDARPARQSSSPSSALAALSAKLRRGARLGFALFVLIHLAEQAIRAVADAARAEPGFELQPWFVALLLLLVWLPFTLFAADELRSRLSGARKPAAGDQARALAVAEWLSGLVVVLFTVLHVAHTAWPLLSGSRVQEDVRPELVLSLSSTSHGVPVQAGAYLCAVGAASFYAARQAHAALGRAPQRVLNGLGVLAYLLGSYAVIRCAGGQLFP
jgi:hypothetical protein